MTEADEIKKKAIETLNQEPPKEKRTHSFADLYKNKGIVKEFLIPDLIPNGEVFVLIGVDGIGKTQITSQLCFAIGTKQEHFLTLKLNSKRGNALIVATEDSKEKFTSAIVKIAHNMNPNVNPEDVGVHFTEGTEFIDLPSFIQEIEDNLKARPTDLVIVDAFQDILLLIDGEINSNSHVNKAMNPFQKLCNTYGCAIGFIHHASKSSAKAKQEKGKFFLVKDDSQGAGRITQKARTVLGLTHDFASSALEDSTTYTNYLHLLKANLSGRRYMKNAVSLTFDTETLLHEASGTVNIEQYENSDKTATDFSPVKKAMAKEVTIEQHQEKIALAFGEETVLTRLEIVNQLRALYGVGKNKIEEKEGYLSYLTGLGLIVANHGMYRKGGEADFTVPIQQMSMPLSKEDWNTVIKPDAQKELNTDQDNEYDSPF